MALLGSIIQRGVIADRPASASGKAGQLWYATDEGKLWHDNGSSWVEVGIYDADLAAIAGLSPTNDDLIQRKSGVWVNRSMAQVKTDLALVKGDVGLGNVDNTSDATKNAAAATLTNKTLTAPTIADFTNAQHDHGDADDGGTLTHAAISDFDTQVRTSRLDQLAAPTADVSLNSHKLTNVTDPTSNQHAATKKYVDDSIVASGGAALTVEEVDGSPTDSAITKIKFPNGTLAIAAHVATYTPAGGGNPAHAYFARQAALLEPLAIEPIQLDTFSYAIGGGATKYVLASWGTKIGSGGRFEIRDPSKPAALRGVTLAGLLSGAHAIILDPTIPTYADAWATYLDRIVQLHDTAPKMLHLTAPSQTVPLLPGPYGSIITRAVNFDFAWIGLGYGPHDTINLANEISDAASQRLDNQLYLPISKLVTSEAHSSSFERSAGVGLATIAYFICPSNWSGIADPLTYTFRDDFMGASLDTSTIWTRTQSTAGNVEIDTNFAWCKLVGNSGWGNNGFLSQATYARAAGKVFLCDLYVGRANAGVIVGWHDGAGVSHSDFLHGVEFQTSGNAIHVWESNNDRGAVGSGWVGGYIYRIRITLGATGATYEIQGGPGTYGALGSSSWTNITPAGTTGSTTPLAIGAAVWGGTSYVGDMRVY